jgi:hypothetical protein
LRKGGVNDEEFDIWFLFIVLPVGMDKVNVVCIHNGVLFSHQEE